MQVLVPLLVLPQRVEYVLSGRAALFISSAKVVVCGSAAVAVLDAERDAGDTNITSYDEALWWAAATITTVGYGDRYPVTGTGRLIAVALMLCGIALQGIVTAMLAAWFLEQVPAPSTGLRWPPAVAWQLWLPKLPDCGRNSRLTEGFPGRRQPLSARQGASGRQLGSSGARRRER